MSAKAFLLLLLGVMKISRSHAIKKAFHLDARRVARRIYTTLGMVVDLKERQRSAGAYAHSTFPCSNESWYFFGKSVPCRAKLKEQSSSMLARLSDSMLYRPMNKHRRWFADIATGVRPPPASSASRFAIVKPLTAARTGFKSL